MKINNVIKESETKRIGKGKNAKTYAKVHCAFDIETSKVGELSFMYIWQFQINDYTVIGRTWEDFEQLVSILNQHEIRIIVWVANLGFEFQFIRKHFPITELFAKEQRQPLKFCINNLEFRDALAISGGSLKQLAKDYTTTQKLDTLDYDVVRNNQDTITDEELQYCINDVIILKEYSEFLWKTYIDNGFIPLTKTSILRREVKENARKWCREKHIKMHTLYNTIKAMFPKSASEYSTNMEWLFRGGYTHCNDRFAGETITSGMIGIDFTSSYPFVMLNRYVPMSPFYETEYKEEYLQKYCCKFIATFYNIKNTTSHSIESKNKIIKYENAIFDNGRLMNADMIRVYLTELDFETYKQFYTWEHMEIERFEIAQRGYIPNYLTDAVYYHYKEKNNLKKQGLSNTQEYAISKSMVNSGYGLTVTRLCFYDVVYDDEWEMEHTDKSYDEMIENQVLSPYWGIWITSQSRRNETKTLFDMEDAVIYSDTDSHKLLGSFYLPYIEMYNKMVILENAKMCYRRGYEMSVLWDIGTFDIESKNITAFKTLGSKRYIYTDEKGFHQTISGLGKQVIKDYCDKHNLDVYDFFTDKMYIPESSTNKLRALYIDNEYSATVNGIEMHEKSGVSLLPVDFTLGLSDDYIELLAMLYNKIIRRIEV